MRIRGLVVLTAATALTLSACSSGSDTDDTATQAADTQETVAEESVDDASAEAEPADEPAEEAVEDAVQEQEAEQPYFYGYGCEGAAITLLDMAAYYAEFDPTDASSDDAATFRALGEAMIATANLPEEGAMGEGVTLADTAIYSAGIGALDLADLIDNAGFTRDIEELTVILGEDATRAVQECGLE